MFKCLQDRLLNLIQIVIIINPNSDQNGKKMPIKINFNQMCASIKIERILLQ